MERVEAVKRFRLKSNSAGTRKLAETPTRFHIENIPTSEYILIPCHSSEKRRYIPFGFMSVDTLASNAVLMLQNAGVYHFGILTSSVHMAWMRAVAGRLEMRYRYSKDVVYNNFVWPVVDEKTKAKIAKTAQDILDARDNHPESSFADLYDDLLMEPDLRKAHKANDKAVLEAYGLKADATESEIVAHLMQLYVEKVAEVKAETAPAKVEEKPAEAAPAAKAAAPAAPAKTEAAPKRRGRPPKAKTTV